MLTVDHIAIPSRDPEASARFLADIFGRTIERDGVDDEFPCLRHDAAVQLLFVASASSPEPHHMAFRSSPDAFAAIVGRLEASAIPFGNDPEDPANGERSDPLGGAGRVYFVDPDGHLFEICA